MTVADVFDSFDLLAVSMNFFSRKKVTFCTPFVQAKINTGTTYTNTLFFFSTAQIFSGWYLPRASPFSGMTMPSQQQPAHIHTKKKKKRNPIPNTTTPNCWFLFLQVAPQLQLSCLQ